MNPPNSWVFFQNIYLFIYLVVPGLSCGMRTLSCGMHVGSSSLTRDRTWAPCIGSAESYPLHHQGSPTAESLYWGGSSMDSRLDCVPKWSPSHLTNPCGLQVHYFFCLFLLPFPSLGTATGDELLTFSLSARVSSWQGRELPAQSLNNSGYFFF